MFAAVVDQPRIFSTLGAQFRSAAVQATAQPIDALFIGKRRIALPLSFLVLRIRRLTFSSGRIGLLALGGIGGAFFHLVDIDIECFGALGRRHRQ